MSRPTKHTLLPLNLFAIYIYIYVVLACLFAGSANAEIYKWVDQNGRVHYGDLPDSKSATHIDIKPNVVRNDERNSAIRKKNNSYNLYGNQNSREEYEKKRKESQMQRDRQAMQAKCDNARQLYEKLTWQRVYNSKSTYEKLYPIKIDGKIATEIQIAKKADETLQFVDSNCGDYPDSRDIVPLP